MVLRGRLRLGREAPETGERFERLADLNGTAVEHILSSAHPDGQWYDQRHDEFVLVVEGAATLEVAGETVRLVAGDWLMLAAHTRHRVVATDAGTSWLAVHAHTAGLIGEEAVTSGGPAIPPPGTPGTRGRRRSRPAGP